MKNMLIIHKMAEKYRKMKRGTNRKANHRTKTKHTDNYTKCIWYKNNKNPKILELYDK